MPSSANYVRDYKQEARTAKARAKKKGDTSPQGTKDRVARNKARAAAIKAGKASKGDGKDIGHKKSLKSGGSRSIKNTKVQSRSSNRSSGGRSGSRAGKSKGGKKGSRK